MAFIYCVLLIIEFRRAGAVTEGSVLAAVHIADGMLWLQCVLVVEGANVQNSCGELCSS